MARFDIIQSMYKTKSPLEFHFDSLILPKPWYYYITQQDINEINKIVMSAKLNGNIKKKREMINDIMTRRGFKRFSAGTNRLVYRYLEDDSFLVKIPIDRTAINDNIREYKNQFLLKPFVPKMFYCSDCGTIAFVERVQPITSHKEFQYVAEDVFYLITNFIIGRYVVDDFGTNSFRNYGLRNGFGVVLLDSPYVFELDGKKLMCNSTKNGRICGGEIDYDYGFNDLYCKKCGKKYYPIDLEKKDKDGSEKIKLINGNRKEIKVSVIIRKNGKTKIISHKEHNTITKYEEEKNKGIVVTRPTVIVKGKIYSNNKEVDINKVIKNKKYNNEKNNKKEDKIQNNKKEDKLKNINKDSIGSVIYNILLELNKCNIDKDARDKINNLIYKNNLSSMRVNKYPILSDIKDIIEFNKFNLSKDGLDMIKSKYNEHIKSCKDGDYKIKDDIIKIESFLINDETHYSEIDDEYYDRYEDEIDNVIDIDKCVEENKTQLQQTDSENIEELIDKCVEENKTQLQQTESENIEQETNKNNKEEDFNGDSFINELVCNKNSKYDKYQSRINKNKYDDNRNKKNKKNKNNKHKRKYKNYQIYDDLNKDILDKY